MNWIQFVLYLSTVYLGYYGLNLLYDLFYLKDPGSKIKNAKKGEITFPEFYSPVQVELPDEEIQEDNFENVEVISSGPIESSGGVSIKELFSLAQNDLIEYTKAIAY
ncbi:hypothetical protein [Sphingobacterium siyangense]|uniref:Uncharacterized protein n=1 Tax=Sphingobacterium siyangense TaxID=459529 RepID=A0A562M6W8_9SPHI|nr:hypothetical protein [Sphingobacterium siyangense]TWI15677.1 hypothetical protein IQ31_04960 [Sphingobacterium siyangense]